MNIAIRLFAGYFLIVGLAAWFLLGIFAREVEPGVRQATEETLVDAANLLAELAADDLAAGTIGHGPFAAAVAQALQREPGALIWGVTKSTVDTHVYVTDANGIVRFDSSGLDLGADYSAWRDVARVLRGEYGARSTRTEPDEPRSSTMYVAAPVLWQGQLIGVVSIGKRVATLMPYADRARGRVLRAGFALLALSALIGLAFTVWLTRSINRLRDYALAVADGKPATPPTTGGRQLSELAASLALMRAKLEGKQYVEQYVQSLTHELKSPLTAIRGAAELLQEAGLPDESRRFAGNIAEQSERMQLVIERLLALARIEQLEVPEGRSEIVLRELIELTVQSRDEQIAARRLSVRAGGDTGVAMRGDPFLLSQALGNLLDNAIAFSPDGGTVELAVATTADRVSIAVSDQGPGAPDYALPRLFERFYSLPRPATGRKSTGLGLAFVREVARLHGGAVTFANRPEGGAIATLTLLR